MRGFILTLLLCVAISTGSVFASGNDYSAMTFLKPDGERITIPNSLDDPQPDSILYDNNSPAALITSTNYWIRVRFTAPVAFDIVSIYMYSINNVGSAAPCSAFVYGSAGPAPGAHLGLGVMAGPLPDFAWIDFNLQDTVSIAAGEDFYVVAGPAPGGQQNGGGWQPVYDNAPTAARSGFKTGGQFGTYTSSNGDYLLRVGGLAGGLFTDASAKRCANETSNLEPAFNVAVLEDLTFNVDIENMGTADIETFAVDFTVENPSGVEVFTETMIGSDLAAGGTQNILTTESLTVTDEGDYLVTVSVSANDDATPENDVTMLRFFVGDNPRWYLYDDDENADSYTGFSAGNGWGLSFAPLSYPAAVTSVRIDVGGTGTGDFRIYMNDEENTPAVVPEWSVTPAVTAGWNEIEVDPPLLLFEGESITLAYLYQSGVSMGYDTDPPNNADNTNMPLIAWQAANDGGSWFEDDGGNLCMQVYFDTSSALPPFPVIELSTEDLDFGEVPINAPATMTFWVYNLGSIDDLHVTAISIVPPPAAAVYDFSPTVFTVAALDSQEVSVTFAPTAVGTSYNGLSNIVNDSNNDQSYSLILRGVGDDPSAAGDIASGLPSEFSLSQNYPNPFNPNTEIRFALPMDADVNLTVINLLGQEVATVASGFHTAGIHTVSFHASNLPSGLYFYRLDAADFTAIRKMMLLK